MLLMAIRNQQHEKIQLLLKRTDIKNVWEKPLIQALVTYCESADDSILKALGARNPACYGAVLYSAVSASDKVSARTKLLKHATEASLWYAISEDLKAGELYLTILFAHNFVAKAIQEFFNDLISKTNAVIFDSNTKCDSENEGCFELLSLVAKNTFTKINDSFFSTEQALTELNRYVRFLQVSRFRTQTEENRQRIYGSVSRYLANHGIQLQDTRKKSEIECFKNLGQQFFSSMIKKYTQTNVVSQSSSNSTTLLSTAPSSGTPPSLSSSQPLLPSVGGSPHILLALPQSTDVAISSCSSSTLNK
jgi:uncharacterized protein YaaR (DUF327 family)